MNEAADAAGGRAALPSAETGPSASARRIARGRSLAPSGRFLVIGFAAGEIPRVPFNLILLKQCQVVGVDWGGWSRKHADGNRGLLDRLAELSAAGRLSPPKPRLYALEDVGQALRDLMDRKVIGKAVLSI